jgi:hypothetical protein
VSGSGNIQQRSWYARTLRLRYLKTGGLTSFLLFECVVAVAGLLALAELVSWWTVAVLPVAVAAMVKVNDLVGPAPGTHGPARSAPPVAGGDHPTKVDAPAYVVPSVDESAAILGLRSSKVYRSKARVAAEAAMEAVPMDTADPETSQR